jgi:hypothetical protein
MSTRGLVALSALIVEKFPDDKPVSYPKQKEQREVLHNGQLTQRRNIKDVSLMEVWVQCSDTCRNLLVQMAKSSGGPMKARRHDQTAEF